MHGHESPSVLDSFNSFSFFSFSSLIPTFHQPVMESLSRFEFETESEGVSEKEREQMGRIVSFKDRSLFLKRPIVRQSFPFSSRFLSSLFSFFMKFSIGKFPFRTFLYDSPKGRFHFFSIFSQDDANIVISLNLNII